MQGSQMSWLVAMRHLGSLAQWLSISTKLYVSAPYHSVLIATDFVLEDFASRLLPGFGAFLSLTRLDINGLKCTERTASTLAAALLGGAMPGLIRLGIERSEFGGSQLELLAPVLMSRDKLRWLSVGDGQTIDAHSLAAL